MALRSRANPETSQPLAPGEPSQTARARARRASSMGAAAFDREPAAVAPGPTSPPSTALINATLEQATRAAAEIRASAEADAERIRAAAAAEWSGPASAQTHDPVDGRRVAPEPPPPAGQPLPGVVEAVEDAHHAVALLEGALRRLADRLTATPPS